MGFGDTAKKLQKVADMAEDVYRKLNELREQVIETKETVEETQQRVDELEVDTAEQRAILEAIAEQQGIDIENVIAEAHISEAEGGDDTDAGESGATTAEDGKTTDTRDESDTTGAGDGSDTTGAGDGSETTDAGHQASANSSN